MRHRKLSEYARSARVRCRLLASFARIMTVLMIAPPLLFACESGTPTIVDGDGDTDGEGSDDAGPVGEWSALGQGVTGLRLSAVNALALGGDGEVYIGGQFPDVDGIPVNGVARWDGREWNAMGAGLNPNIAARVNGIVVDDAGVVYAAGTLTSYGAARWDGERWSPLGGGLDLGFVNAVALAPNGDLYLGGGRLIGRNPDGSTTIAFGLIRWDGSRWHALIDADSGEGLSGQEVYAIAPDGSGGVYVGGFLSSAGGTAVRGLAYWDGERWSDVGGGVTGSVRAISVRDDGLVVAGGLSAAGNIAVDKMARWDGTRWSPFANSNPPVAALATGPDGRIYAGGQSFEGHVVWRWNDGTWEGLATGGILDRSPVTVLEFDSDRYLYAAGNFRRIDNTDAGGVARWNGLVN